MYLTSRKKNIFKFIVVLALFFIFSFPAFSLAEEIPGGTEAASKGLGEAKAGLPEFDITAKIGSIISTILGFVGILFLILMIAGGLMWMTAGGSEDKLGKAKKLITGAVVGMLIVFSAYAITYFVTETLLKR